MPLLTRKTELLVAIESIEGTSPTLNSTHYRFARNPSIRTPQDIEDTEVTGQSLSPDVGVPGRSSFEAQFEIDTYNLGSVASPAEHPFLLSCGYRQTSVFYWDCGTPTVSTWAGQTLTDGAANTATLAAPIGTSARMYVINAAAGFPSGTTINVGGGTVTLTNTVADGFCYGYVPDSTPTAVVNLSSGTWTGTPPVVGELVTNGLDGAAAARGIVMSIAGTSLEIQSALPHAAFLTGQTVTGLTGGGTNTVGASGQVLLRVPSLSIRYNVDGWYRLGTGCRGSIDLNLEAGKIGRWSCNMQGQLNAHGDTPLLTGISTVSPSNLPRWHNATASISGFEIPVSRMSVQGGAQVALLGDAHSANGVRGASITAREAVLTADFDQMPAAVLNYQLRVQNATVMPIFTMWGSTVGLRNAVFVPRAQIYVRDDGDRDGVLTADLTARPKKLLGTGDDEIYYLFGV